jgi:hypothetical protein
LRFNGTGAKHRSVEKADDLPQPERGTVYENQQSSKIRDLHFRISDSVPCVVGRSSGHLFFRSESHEAWKRFDTDHQGRRHCSGAADLPQPVGERAPALVRVILTAKELVGVLDPASGTTYRYWTFNGKVPGPFIRVMQGDTVEVTLANAKDSSMVHSIDFHAAIRPGGGSALAQVPPGQSKSFTFQATVSPGPLLAKSRR